MCATDGGLKDQVGTSSYALFLPQDKQVIISQSTREYQPWSSALSPKQEMLGPKDTLRAEMDVALELGRKQELQWWVQRMVV